MNPVGFARAVFGPYLGHPAHPNDGVRPRPRLVDDAYRRLPPKDKAVELARTVLRRQGGMVLTAAEANLLSRELLLALGLG